MHIVFSNFNVIKYIQRFLFVVGFVVNEENEYG